MIDAALRGLYKAAATSYSELEGELRPGDVLLASSQEPPKETSPLAKAMYGAFRHVSKAVQGDKTHSLLYVGRGKVVEATRFGGGANERPLRDALKQLDAIVLRPNVTAAQRQEAVQRAKALAKKQTPYDTAGLLRALLTVGSDARRSDAVTCSTLITSAYAPKLTDAPRDATKPSDFLRSGKLKAILEFKNPGRRDRGK